MKRILLLLPMLALIPWIACNEQPDSSIAQGGDAQPPQAEGQFSQQELASQTMEGTLTKVDPEGKRISLRVADGSERSFSYSDQTLVTGAGDTVEGLNKMNGARVKVWYAAGAEGNAAEKIEILGQIEDPADQGHRELY